jgi:hypothetical protein
MTLTYINDENREAEKADVSIATPAIRETFIVEVPDLSPKDAQNAALFKSRTLYPGSFDDIFTSTRLFKGKHGSTVLVQILRPFSAKTKPSQISTPLLAPQDFLNNPEEKELALFITPGWLEWLAFEDGRPIHQGLQAIDKEVDDTELQDAIQATSSFVMWSPLASGKMAERIGSRLFGNAHNFTVRYYEETLSPTLRDGRNSFGPRNDLRKKQRRITTACLAALDMLLVCLLISNTLEASRAEYEALRREKNRLSTIAAESARVQSEIKALGGEDAKVARKTATPYALLELLTQNLPDDCTLLSVDIRDASFTLTGTASDAFKVTTKLENSGRFKDLLLDRVLPIAESKRWKFSLSGSLTDE